MRTEEITNPDTVNATSFLLLKYIIEQLCESTLEHIDDEDELKKSIKDSLSGKVSEDLFQQIIMGYCISEPKALNHNIQIVMGMLARQVEAMQDSIGG